MTLKVKSLSLAQAHPYGEKEKMILEAARRRIERYGFLKVTMEEVAEDVGVVKGSIYYYFPTKENLFGAVIREEQKKFAHEISDLSESEGSYAGLIRRYIEKRRQFFRNLLNMSRLDHQSWARIRSALHELFRNFEQQELVFLQQVFQEGQTSGEFTPCDSRRMANLLLHALQGLYLRTIRDANNMHTEERTNSQLDCEVKLFAEVFLCGIRIIKKEKSAKHENR